MKNLVIVESPSKVKKIEQFLGPDYKVMSSFGHIRDLEKRGMSVDIEDNFTPKYVIPADKREVVKSLKAAASKADTVWLATDEDREGEAIAWHLYEVLGLKPENTNRICFHEITKPALLEAVANPRKIDIDRVNSQQARRVLDRIVGFELSPVLWKKIKPSLSAGRVQSATLRLVCEREMEIRNFVPEPFYRLTAIFISPSGVAFKARSPQKFNTRQEAMQIIELCKGAHFSVSDMERKPLQRKPAAPFTTSTLQQEAGRKLHLNVATTMRVAQRLYEEGHITYMRTDSTNLSELAIRDIAKTITADYGKEYLQTRHYHTNTKNAQEAHEAIRPTYISNKTIEGSPVEQRLYQLIWKRAVASQMSEARLEKTTIDIAMDNNDTTFDLQGETLLFEGFMKVYGASVDGETDAIAPIDDASESGLLPALSVGDALGMRNVTATERFTIGPVRYTEPELIKKMDKIGIGRPSTTATTVTTLRTREYIVDGDSEGMERNYNVISLDGDKVTEVVRTERYGATRGHIVPTDVGMVVIDFLTQHFPDIVDYGFTAKIEEKIDEIAEGKLPWQEEMADFYRDFHPGVERADSMRMEHKVGERVLGVDPKSGRRVSVKIGRFGPVAQIGESSDDEKPLFASLNEGQSLQTITLDEALKLFELPRKLGEYQDMEVSAAIGRFGPYVHHGKQFVSIPKEMDPYTITLDEAIRLIENKQEEEANRHIKSFDEMPGLEVLKGRFGPYIAYKKEGDKKATNYKIPKGKDPEALTLEEVKAIMEAQDAAPAKRRPTRKTKK